MCKKKITPSTIRALVFGRHQFFGTSEQNIQCNYNSFFQIINFRGLFRNALRCRNTGACRILVPLWYMTVLWQLQGHCGTLILKGSGKCPESSTFCQVVLATATNRPCNYHEIATPHSISQKLPYRALTETALRNVVTAEWNSCLVFLHCKQMVTNIFVYIALSYIFERST